MTPYITFGTQFLGSIEFNPGDFAPDIYEEFESAEFQGQSVFEKHERVSRILFEEIAKEGKGFLLPKVISYISRVRRFLSSYNLGSFEFWLNHHLEIDDTKKDEIRGKITGKWIPRSEYQRYFPIGGQYIHPGSHYSCAHYSPDLDTTVASFSCFLAAFAAKVGEGRHHWMLPGGPPSDSIEVDFVFRKALGKEVFAILAETSKKLSITSLDLLKQKHITRKRLSDLSYDVDHDGVSRPVILVDGEGRYLNDWRTGDVDSVRSIIRRFLSLLTAYSNHFHVTLISLFALRPLRQKDVTSFNQHFFNSKLNALGTREFTEEQRRSLDRFIKVVLKISSGYEFTFKELIERFKEQFHFRKFEEVAFALASEALFDKNGDVIEERGVLFTALEKVLSIEKQLFQEFVGYLDTLAVALEVKEKVLGHGPRYLSHNAEYEEIVEEMGDFSHLIVNYRDGDNLYPLGVIYAADLYKKILATTSWNDFSNPTETDTRPYVEVISFVDHHKSRLETTRPSSGTILDAHASNSIFARYSLEINDRYSTGGMTLDSVNAQIQEVSKELELPSNMRIMQRLLQKKKILSQRQEYFVSYEREILEYIQYLFAILDDTDLLTKVTEYDVVSVAALLNHLKSLMLRKETEIVHFDDIPPNDSQYSHRAAKKLLHTKDLYSLVAIIYLAKEAAIENIIKTVTKDRESPFFQDTKILADGTASVGQFKHFVGNAPHLQERVTDLRKIWVDRAKAISKENPDVILHLFMVSTITSADELFADTPPVPTYKDQIWIWIPPGNHKAEHHLSVFLKAFLASPKMLGVDVEVLFGASALAYQKALSEATSHHFKSSTSPSLPTMAVLGVPQKKIVSRKTDITPYL